MPKVHAYCHCSDCRELLQVPFHSVLAFAPEKVQVTQGAKEVIAYQHPTKKMQRIFCKLCGEVLYNTNAMGWKLISQLLFKKCNNNSLPMEFKPTKHFFYKDRVIDINDHLEKSD